MHPISGCPPLSNVRAKVEGMTIVNERAICAFASRAGMNCLVFALLGWGGLAQTGRAQDGELQQRLSWEAAQSAARKLEQVREAAGQGRSFGSVRISEVEANSYLQFEMLPYYPPGVSRVRLQFHPARTQGSLQADFGKLKAAFGGSGNPLIDYFLQGVHTLGADGTFTSSGGIARFALQTVTLDGVALPRMVVDFLIERYLKPSFPEVSIDRPFRLPFSIDKMSVEEGNVVLMGAPPDPL